MSIPKNLRMANAITAGTTQTQAGAVQLDVGTFGHRVTVVGTAADAVKLPKAINGKIVAVKNADASDSMGVFPSPGDTINALAQDAVYAQAALKNVLFICYVDGTWDTIPA
jgi:hypothetical protein